MTAFDLREKLGDTRLEYFAADEADLRMALGLNGKMLAPTKTDFQPNFPLRSTESGTRFQPACLRDGQQEPWQQSVDPDFLRRAESAPAAAPENQLTLRQLHMPGRLEGAPQLVREIKPLPRKATIRLGGATEMAISCRARVDWFIQAKVCSDAARRQIHQLLQYPSQLLLVNHAAGRPSRCGAPAAPMIGWPATTLARSRPRGPGRPTARHS